MITTGHPKYEPSQKYSPEYVAYLSALADNIIFTKYVDRDLPESPDPISAINFGIQRELDSIAYYQESMGFISPDQRDLLKKIIEEERKHYLELSGLREEMT